MATPKEAHSLTTYFIQQYKKKYHIAPRVNRNSARWSFGNILEDLSMEETKSLIDYYFGTVSAGGHDLEWFFYNYDKLAIAKENTDEDRAALRSIREQTRRRTEEWRKRKSGSN